MSNPIACPACGITIASSKTPGITDVIYHSGGGKDKAHIRFYDSRAMDLICPCGYIGRYLFYQKEWNATLSQHQQPVLRTGAEKAVSFEVKGR